MKRKINPLDEIEKWQKMKYKQSYYLSGQVYEVLSELDKLLSRLRVQS